jgi:chromosome segregation ATPase
MRSALGEVVQGEGAGGAHLTVGDLSSYGAYGGGGNGGGLDPEVLEARQEVAVLEAAAAVLEEKLAGASLETAAAREAHARAEEKAQALAQENQWLQSRLVSLQAEGDGEAAEAHDMVAKLKRELAAAKADRDASQAAMKGHLQELRVGASAVGAKIALTEQLEKMKQSIAPLQAALEAERAWSKEMEAQLEGEKTAKLALAAKSSAMVKALRQQLDEAKTAAVSARAASATPSMYAYSHAPPPSSMEGSGYSGGGGRGGEASVEHEADVKAAMEERQALSREVEFLKDRVKVLTSTLETEKTAARERELRMKGKYDAMLERALEEQTGAASLALNAQVGELQAALEQAFEREAELKAQLAATYR